MNPRRLAARRLSGAAVLTALALGTAACGSSSPSSTGAPSTSAAADTSGAGGVSAAAAELATYTGVPSFTASGPAIDISSLKGKTIYSIPQSSSIPFLQLADQAEKKISTKYGIDFVEYTTQGNPSEWTRGINAAIAAHAGAILLQALDPRLVQPQVDAAKKAGIPVLTQQFFDLSQADKVPSDLAGTRSDNFTEAAKLEADQAIVDTKGKADVLVVENEEQMSTLAMIASLKAEFAANCPGCKVTFVNVPSADWATKIQSEVQSAIVKDPGLNYVIPIYDPMVQFVMPAITATGKTSSIGVSTFNGTPAGLGLVASGPTVRMDIGENLEWLGYANLDEAFRAMLGQPTLPDEKTALRVFTKDNVGDTGNPPAFNTGFGSAYVSGYATLWGQS